VRVLLVSSGYSTAKVGGVGTVVSALINHFREHGINYDVVCLEEGNENIHTVYSWGPEPLKSLTFGLSFRRFYRQHQSKWDIVHFHLPNAWGALLSLYQDTIENTLVTLHTIRL